MDNFIKSPLNYTGGKFKLLSQIIPLFPTKINTFIDLFCGGCNVGINVNAQKYLFNDNLIYLIDLYNNFKDKNINDILNHINDRINQFKLSLDNVDGYNKLRDLYNNEKNPLDLFVLISYSFNHQIRFNSLHEFNTSFGKQRSSFNDTIKNNLINFVNKIHQIDCRFIKSNFDKLNFNNLSSDDFVYCDPPYLITTGSYNDGKRGFTGWSNNEEIKLLSLLNELNEKNIKFALSNVLYHKGKENNLLLDWISDNNYNVHHLKMNYANSSYHTLDRNINSSDEVLITNYNFEDNNFRLF